MHSIDSRSENYITLGSDNRCANFLKLGSVFQFYLPRILSFSFNGEEYSKFTFKIFKMPSMLFFSLSLANFL
jgi:hypothetical protein